jgi:hypothetical protein
LFVTSLEKRQKERFKYFFFSIKTMTSTKTNYALTQDVAEGELLSAYVVAPFDKGLEVLRTNDYELISLKDNARLRMQEGHNAVISQNGNWVKEDVLYVPRKGVFITPFPIIANNAKQATQAHAEGRDIYFTDEQVEQSLVGAIPLDGTSIPTKRFGENELTVNIFGEHAENYGKFLNDHGIIEMPVWITYAKEKPFARKVWFRRLGDLIRSGLDCRLRVLHDGDYMVRGVRENSAKDAAQKISAQEIKVEENVAEKGESYTPEQISYALNSLKISGLESLLFDQLRKQ